MSEKKSSESSSSNPQYNVVKEAQETLAKADGFVCVFIVKGDLLTLSKISQNTVLPLCFGCTSFVRSTEEKFKKMIQENPEAKETSENPEKVN